jgi:hypothetical protein
VGAMRGFVGFPLAGIHDSNFAYGHIQPKPPLRAREEPGLKAQRQVILVHVSARWLDLARVGRKGKYWTKCE